MGASVIRGRRLERQVVQKDDGRRFCELVPVDGSYEFLAYSSVESLVRFGESQGIPRDHWPIYYGLDKADIPLDDVQERCDKLRFAFGRPVQWYLRQLAEPRDDSRTLETWFPRVHEWLSNGEVFVVLE